MCERKAIVLQKFRYLLNNKHQINTEYIYYSLNCCCCCCLLDLCFYLTVQLYVLWKAHTWIFMGFRSISFCYIWLTLFIQFSVDVIGKMGNIKISYKIFILNKICVVSHKRLEFIKKSKNASVISHIWFKYCYSSNEIYFVKMR